MERVQVIDNATHPAGRQLLEDLAWASHVRIATAFAKGSGVARLMDAFKRVLSDGGGMEVVYGLDFRITDPEAIELFCELADTYPETVNHYAYSNWDLALSQAFHPKLYICTAATGKAHVLAGSSNLTHGGLWENFEANVAITGTTDDAVVRQANAIFERAFDHPHRFRPTHEYVAAYRAMYQRATSAPFTPNPPQHLISDYEELKRLESRQADTDCSKHAGQANAGNRRGLDASMARLPRNQAGSGRHKCPYCAYEHGYGQAQEDMQASRIASGPRSPQQNPTADCNRHAGQGNRSGRAQLDARMACLPSNQSGEGRHKCPYCAYERGYWQAIDDNDTG